VKAGVWDKKDTGTAKMLQIIQLHAIFCGNQNLIEQILKLGLAPTLDIFSMLSKLQRSVPNPLMAALLVASYQEAKDGQTCDPDFARAVRRINFNLGRDCIPPVSIPSEKVLRKWILAVRMQVSAVPQ
jgi:hypothetical protein